jgi:hypothetical protein
MTDSSLCVITQLELHFMPVAGNAAALFLHGRLQNSGKLW